MNRFPGKRHRDKILPSFRASQTPTATAYLSSCSTDTPYKSHSLGGHVAQADCPPPQPLQQHTSAQDPGPSDGV